MLSFIAMKMHAQFVTKNNDTLVPQIVILFQTKPKLIGG